MAKQRTHRFVLTITMDKPCSAKLALREARDTIYGQHYCTQFNDHEPGEFRVRSIRRATKGD